MIEDYETALPASSQFVLTKPARRLIAALQQRAELCMMSGS
jgi:hypothetical protein